MVGGMRDAILASAASKRILSERTPSTADFSSLIFPEWRPLLFSLLFP
jgi:hypothetical protein